MSFKIIWNIPYFSIDAFAHTCIYIWCQCESPSLLSNEELYIQASINFSTQFIIGEGELCKQKCLCNSQAVWLFKCRSVQGWVCICVCTQHKQTSGQSIWQWLQHLFLPQFACQNTEAGQQFGGPPIQHTGGVNRERVSEAKAVLNLV